VPIEHRFVEANGIRHHLVEQGSGPLVLLVHGWPESWYSWRHQIGALADAGYRVVAPDVRGYGQTDAPPAIHDYAMRTLVEDAAGIVRALGEEKAVVVGHDWGAVIAWHCALLHPEVFRAVAALSIPLPQRSIVPTTVAFRKRFEGQFFYILYFQEPGVAEAELEADVRRSLRLVYYAASGDAPVGPGFFGKPAGAKLLDGMADPPVLPAWLTEKDLDFYAGEFARTGFRGGINRYRNMDGDWEDLAPVGTAPVTVPAIFVAGARDMAVMRPDAIEAMRRRVPDLRSVLVIPDEGHWIQQEAPAQVNQALIGFLRGLP
jgi:pimeloyl-ACP methyl ester carboxylesterase